MYHWYTFLWWNDGGDGNVGVKIGPLTVGAYVWLDGYWRVMWTFLGGREHIVFGGPLVPLRSSPDSHS